MAGRPKGSKNLFSNDITSKSVSLPKETWDKLAEIGSRQGKTPQRVAAEIILSGLASKYPIAVNGNQ